MTARQNDLSNFWCTGKIVNKIRKIIFGLRQDKGKQGRAKQIRERAG
jgi:hypothetical protein